jgi:hypothetical protein
METRLLEQLREYFPNQVIYEDGVINTSLYNANPAGKKILFITKEPNARNHDDNPDRSFVTEWNSLEPDYRFAKTIAEWSYGIINDFPPYEQAAQNAIKEKYLQRIAFMNIKKTGGNGLSREGDFLQLLSHEKYCELINQQIGIIGADIIILGLSWGSVVSKIFQSVDWKHSGYAVKVGRYKNASIIDFYHPSSRIVPAASYSLLQNVLTRIGFLGLNNAKGPGM